MRQTPPTPWLAACGALLVALVVAGCADGAEPLDLLTITDVSPASARQGEVVRLHGQFGPPPARPRAFVAGVCTAVVGWSEDAVTILIPHGAGLGPRTLVVSADGVVSNAVGVEVIGPALPADRIYCDEGT